MSNVVMFISFNLADGASEQEFLLASEKLHSEFISKQKGFISWKQLIEGGLWADLLTWESMDDANNAFEASGTSALTREFFSFIDEKSVKTHLFTVKKEF
ncbi:MAG: hypothetical protein FWE91_08270 [Defluviitaleaceae bacterium]|nr:hypothetical protein [Defluviitaleaceae bacterium]MCL2835318.1 hypothetical protein [Defluviitaleaceae bacterium]